MQTESDIVRTTGDRLRMVVQEKGVKHTPRMFLLTLLIHPRTEFPTQSMAREREACCSLRHQHTRMQANRPNNATIWGWIPIQALVLSRLLDTAIAILAPPGRCVRPFHLLFLFPHFVSIRLSIPRYLSTSHSFLIFLVLRQVDRVSSPFSPRSFPHPQYRSTNPSKPP
jgi:hypothetical protein